MWRMSAGHLPGMGTTDVVTENMSLRQSVDTSWGDTPLLDAIQTNLNHKVAVFILLLPWFLSPPDIDDFNLLSNMPVGGIFLYKNPADRSKISHLEQLT